MTGIDEGGSGMLLGSDQDVVLVMEDEDEDEGETGEPPALLPFSQFVLADGRRTSPGRFVVDEPVDKVEFVGEIIVGGIAVDICF